MKALYFAYLLHHPFVLTTLYFPIIENVKKVFVVHAKLNIPIHNGTHPIFVLLAICINSRHSSFCLVLLWGFHHFREVFSLPSFCHTCKSLGYLHLLLYLLSFTIICHLLVTFLLPQSIENLELHSLLQDEHSPK